jgi:hypothetical protein
MKYLKIDFYQWGQVLNGAQPTSTFDSSPIIPIFLRFLISSIINVKPLCNLKETLKSKILQFE